ncbi:MAG TPA: hypothetical protein VGF13_12865, partial [Verrucomicrobiae bacterium]
MILTKQLRLLLCILPLLMPGCGGEENTVENTLAPDPRTTEMRTTSKLNKLSTGLNLTAEQQGQ